MRQLLKLTLIVSVLITAAGVILVGCEETGVTASETPDKSDSDLIYSMKIAPNQMAGQHAGNLNVELSALRRATAPYHNFEKAKAAGYDAEVTPCWYNSEAGGAMGYHYANMEFLTNGSADLLTPEALMFEPNANGQFSLVGVEYIVPVEDWSGEEPPSLLGQEFHDNGVLYTLHIWLWKNNPEGMFAPWNPKVSCEHADESEDMAGM